MRVKINTRKHEIKRNKDAEQKIKEEGSFSNFNAEQNGQIEEKAGAKSNYLAEKIDAQKRFYFLMIG